MKSWPTVICPDNIYCFSVEDQVHALVELCRYSSQSTLCALVDAIANEVEDEKEAQTM